MQENTNKQIELTENDFEQMGQYIGILLQLAEINDEMREGFVELIPTLEINQLFELIEVLEKMVPDASQQRLEKLAEEVKAIKDKGDKEIAEADAEFEDLLNDVNKAMDVLEK
jgi:flagellar motility protein MotE (MotC chaperone)